MSKLKFIFIAIVYTTLFTITPKVISAKSIQNLYDEDKVSNYFSGIVSLIDNQYLKSYKYLKQLDGLESSHLPFSQYYQHSLVNLEKFNEAFTFSKKLEKLKLDNFESNLIIGVYYIKKEKYDLAKNYFKKLYKLNQGDSLSGLISNNLFNLTSISNLNEKDGLALIKNSTSKFKNIYRIQDYMVNCYYNSDQVGKKFEDLISNNSTEGSRYIFYQASYLDNNNMQKNAINLVSKKISSNPQSLILQQFLIDLKNRKSNDYNNQFDCKKIDNILAEFFYIVSNSLQILIDKKKDKEALLFIEKSFKKILKPNIYETYDYARILKNNEKYEESIKYFTDVLSLIEKKHELYPKASEGRGVAYERLDQWSLAEKDFLNSLKEKPNQPYVINYLAYSWIEKGLNIEKSLNMLKNANKLRENDGYIVDSLGWAFFKLKRYEEAKKYLQLAVRLLPSDPIVNDHFGDSLWMVSQPIQARYYWNYALNLKKTKIENKSKIEKKLIVGL